eukprot:Tbor_TRINITY_DN9901_c0_g1::TRINITY_DN9901_c0_g1_i1::g.17631::m.17631
MHRVGSLEDVRYKIHHSTTLGWEGDDHAKDIMAAVCVKAEVLMARHKWSVVRVVEFFPKSPALLGLNVNHGEVIKLRFRRYGASTQRNGQIGTRRTTPKATVYKAPNKKTIL